MKDIFYSSGWFINLFNYIFYSSLVDEISLLKIQNEILKVRICPSAVEYLCTTIKWTGSWSSSYDENLEKSYKINEEDGNKCVNDY